jgi:hypothetical protein
LVLLNLINWRDFYVGLLTGIGFTKFWLISDGLLTRTALPYRKPPVAVWIISLVPLLTIFWTLDPVTTFLWFWRVHVIYGSYSKIESRKSLALGVGVVLLIQLVLSWNENVARPDALTDNAQRYGMASWALIGTNPYLSVLGGANIGMSAARLTVFLVLYAAVWTRQKAIILAAVMAVVMVFVYTPDARFNIEQLTQSFILRVQLVTGQSKAAIEPKDTSTIFIEKVQDDSPLAAIILDRPDLIGVAEKDENGYYIRHWVWNGYGYGSFNDRTGLSKPHNTYLLLWYDLGIFSILFAIGVLLFVLTTNKKPWWLLISTMVYMFFIDDFFGLPIGLYVIGFQFYMVSAIENSKNTRSVSFGSSDQYLHALLVLSDTAKQVPKAVRQSLQILSRYGDG